MPAKESRKESILKHGVPDKEQPFSKAEYRRRLRAVQEGMRKLGVDILYLTSPESMYYISGYRAEWYQAQSPKNWLPVSAIAVHADHDKLIALDNEEEMLLIRYTTLIDDVRVFSDDLPTDMISWAVRELKKERWLPGTVGLEMWSYRPNRAVSELLEASFRRVGCRVVDASDILREVRSRKSSRELDYIKRAAKVADIGMSAAVDKMRPGVTELEVYGEVVRAMAAAGGENPAITMPVASGRKSACAHALASRRRIRKGDVVNVDVCGVTYRYHANMARTFSVGKPHREVEDVVRKSAGAFTLLKRVLKPGVPIAKVMNSMRAYYENAGILDDRWWFGGYELGASFPPDWVGPWAYDAYTDMKGRKFVPGTVVNYESNFYLPKRAGVSLLINTLMFDERRAHVLGETPNEIIIV